MNSEKNMLFALLNTGENTELFQEYLKKKKNKTKEEELALAESEIIYTSVIKAMISILGFILGYTIGYRILLHLFHCDKAMCIFGGMFISCVFGGCVYIIASYLMSYPKKHWNIYINKISNIIDEVIGKKLELSDDGFFDEFMRVKKILEKQGDNIDRLIEEKEMESYDKYVKKGILISIIVLLIFAGFYVFMLVEQMISLEDKSMHHITFENPYEEYYDNY